MHCYTCTAYVRTFVMFAKFLHPYAEHMFVLRMVPCIMWILSSVPSAKYCLHLLEVSVLIFYFIVYCRDTVAFHDVRLSSSVCLVCVAPAHTQLYIWSEVKWSKKQLEMKWIEESADKIMLPVCLTLKYVNKAKSKTEKLQNGLHNNKTVCSIFETIVYIYISTCALEMTTSTPHPPPPSFSLAFTPPTHRFSYAYIILCSFWLSFWSFFIVHICCVSISEKARTHIVHVHNFGAISYNTVNAYRLHTSTHISVYVCICITFNGFLFARTNLLQDWRISAFFTHTYRTTIPVTQCV